LEIVWNWFVMIAGKQKTRRLVKRAGFSKKSNDPDKILNYLPASLMRDSPANTGFGFPQSLWSECISKPYDARMERVACVGLA
jgi:hypothetical protein